MQVDERRGLLPPSSPPVKATVVSSHAKLDGGYSCTAMAAAELGNLTLQRHHRKKPRVEN